MADADQNAHVAQILSSYLSNNTVPAAELSGIIESVKRAFGAAVMGSAMSATTESVKTWEPAVPVKKSITPDALTCLCCGQSFKSLRRHLQTAHQLDASEYRAAFNLKADYPLVAPNYAAKRSELAKAIGLGRKPKEVEVTRPKNRRSRASAKSKGAAA